jgi:ATP-dependent helicase/nuclease subunit A
VRDIVAALITHPVFDSDYKRATDWRAAVRRALGVPSDGTRESVLAAALADDGFDWATLRDYAAAMVEWGTATGLAKADSIAHLLAAGPDARVAMLADLLAIGLRADGEPLKAPARRDALHQRLCQRLTALRDLANGLELADIAALHLRVGQTLAADYADAKHQLGALDYDDLIRRAARLLRDVDAAYVLYKLDQRIDHVLVDEGQDTNAVQWAIIDAVTADFFAGEGAREGLRTQFAVGDYKQAIFGFQGTDPREFERARQATEQRVGSAGCRFDAVDLSRTYRSVGAVLDVVDRVIMDAGAAAFGVVGDIAPHRSHRDGEAGEVVVWSPVIGAVDDGDGADTGALADSEIELARRIAAEIADWIASGDVLASTRQPIGAGDILVLVRSRGELVSALVAALRRANVAVAGVDRLRLTAPIAVKDVLALARFALQPGDDLSLAALLVSPFLGWSQDQLYRVAHARQSTLWRALRVSADAAAQAATAWLGEVLALADYCAPYEFFETILSGKLEGRARLVARLGDEARDPIEEVLNQALLFEATNSPSLQAFLQWIDTGDVEVKRDPDAPHDAVRIMTVHGAKGLQAPIVILADAVKAAPKAIKPPLTLDLPSIGPAPIFFGSQRLLVGPARDAHAARARDEAEETMRLLYVAMTRAQDRLYVGGACGRRPPPPGNWHQRIGDALRALGADVDVNQRWGETLRYARGAPLSAVAVATPPSLPTILPDWVLTPPPAEERPPRPLSPSSPTEEEAAEFPPPAPGMQDAARRGRILHQLFERIGAVEPAARERSMRAWLGRNAPDCDADAIVAEVLTVLAAPEVEAFFAADAYAEAPFSAVVDGRVITGTIDRLLVTADMVAALDFKTGVRVPKAAADVPVHHHRQMAAYGEALARIFPDRRVALALLYTAAPRLVWL